MAIVTEDDLTYGLRGRVGDCVYRRFNGKILVSRRPRKQNVSNQSVAQRSTRSNFKAAAAWAKSIRRDPAWEAFYRQRATELGLTNGYVAAIGDYMRNPEIGRQEVVKRRPDGAVIEPRRILKPGWSDRVAPAPSVLAPGCLAQRIGVTDRGGRKMYRSYERRSSYPGSRNVLWKTVAALDERDGEHSIPGMVSGGCFLVRSRTRPATLTFARSQSLEYR